MIELLFCRKGVDWRSRTSDEVEIAMVLRLERQGRGVAVVDDDGGLERTITGINKACVQTRIGEEEDSRRR